MNARSLPHLEVPVTKLPVLSCVYSSRLVPFVHGPSSSHIIFWTDAQSMRNAGRFFIPCDIGVVGNERRERKGGLGDQQSSGIDEINSEEANWSE